MELSIVGIDDTSERLEKHSHVQIHITVKRIRLENTQLIEVYWLLATTLARKLNQSTSKNNQPVSTTFRTGRSLVNVCAHKNGLISKASAVRNFETYFIIVQTIVTLHSLISKYHMFHVMFKIIDISRQKELWTKDVGINTVFISQTCLRREM